MTKDDRSDTELWAAAQSTIDSSGLRVFPALPGDVHLALPWYDEDPEGFIQLAVDLGIRLVYVESVNHRDSDEFRAGSVQWVYGGIPHSWLCGDLVAFGPVPGHDPHGIHDDEDPDEGWEQLQEIASALVERPGVRSSTSPEKLRHAVESELAAGEVSWHHHLDPLVRHVQALVLADRLPTYVEKIFADPLFHEPAARKRAADTCREILEQEYRVWGWSHTFEEARNRAEDRWEHAVAPEAKRLRERGMTKSTLSAQLGVGSKRLDRILLYAATDAPST